MLATGLTLILKNREAMLGLERKAVASQVIFP